MHAHRDAFVFQEAPDLRGHILVLAADQARAHLHHRDARAEAAEHLRELQADVAAADHDEVLGHEVDVHHRDVGEIGHRFDSRHLRHARPPTDVEEDFLRRQLFTVHLHAVLGGKTRVTSVHLSALQPLHPLLHVLAGLADDLVLSRLHALHVDARGAVHQHAVVGRAPRHVRRVGARHHRLGGRAAVVHAGAAELVPLHHGDFHAGTGEARSEGRPGLAGADDEGVEASGHDAILEALLRLRRNARPRHGLTRISDGESGCPGGTPLAESPACPRKRVPPTGGNK
jgi:hypothetical protein